MIPACMQQRVATIAIRTYAAHSWLYYQRDLSLITDAEFDDLCAWLVDNFDWVKKWDISGYLDLDALKAGTGHHLKVIGQTLDYAMQLESEHLARNPKPKRKPKRETKPFVSNDLPPDVADLI